MQQRRAGSLSRSAIEPKRLVTRDRAVRHLGSLRARGRVEFVVVRAKKKEKRKKSRRADDADGTQGAKVPHITNKLSVNLTPRRRRRRSPNSLSISIAFSLAFASA